MRSFRRGFVWRTCASLMLVVSGFFGSIMGVFFFASVALAQTPPATNAAVPAATSSTGGGGTTSASVALPPCPPPIPPVPLTLSINIGGTSQVTNLNEYIATLDRYLIGIVALVATIMAVYGGFRYLMGTVAGDISKGKSIITQAVMGLVLTLGAYVILSTVNPATVNLKPLTLKNLSCVSLATIRSYDTIQTNGSARGACATDQMCETRSRGAACLMTTDNVRTDSGEGGLCTDGTLGGRCRCSGRGCLVDANTTNNHGQKTFSCQSDLTCVIQILDATTDGWYCQNETTVSSDVIARERAAYNQAHPGEAEEHSCHSNQDCAQYGEGQTCMLSSSTPGNADPSTWTGICVNPTNVAPGMPCKCAGLGCSVVDTRANNGGRRIADCSAGTTCTLVRPASAQPAAPNAWTWEWRCHNQNVASDNDNAGRGGSFDGSGSTGSF